MNEINKITWPNASGIGRVTAGALSSTTRIAKTYGVIKKTPVGATNYAWTNLALKNLKASGIDIYGASYKPITVHLLAGGK
jgi:hypothetical protein